MSRVVVTSTSKKRMTRFTKSYAFVVIIFVLCIGHEWSPRVVKFRWRDVTHSTWWWQQLSHATPTSLLNHSGCSASSITTSAVSDIDNSIVSPSLDELKYFFISLFLPRDFFADRRFVAYSLFLPLLLSFFSTFVLGFHSRQFLHHIGIFIIRW